MEIEDLNEFGARSYLVQLENRWHNSYNGQNSS